MSIIDISSGISGFEAKEALSQWLRFLRATEKSPPPWQQFPQLQDWSAESMFAAILVEAKVYPPSFDRAYIEQMSERCTQADENQVLLTELSVDADLLTHLVGTTPVNVTRLFEIDALREILGIVNVVHAAVQNDLAQKMGLSKSEQAFLKVINHATIDGGPWWFQLSRSRADVLWAHHREAHPLTPHLRELAEANMLVLTDEHVEFRGSQLKQWNGGASVAAEVWRRHPAGITQSITDWLQRVDWFYAWPQAFEILSVEEARPIAEHLARVLCDSTELQVEAKLEAERIPRESWYELSHRGELEYPEIGTDLSSSICLIWWWLKRDVWSDLRDRPVRFAEAIFRFAWPLAREERTPLTQLIELAEAEPTFLTALVGIGAASARSNELVQWIQSPNRCLFAWVAFNQVMSSQALIWVPTSRLRTSFLSELRIITDSIMRESLISAIRNGQAEIVAQIAYDWAFIRWRTLSDHRKDDKVVEELESTLSVVIQAFQTVNRPNDDVSDAVFDQFLQSVEFFASVQHGLPIWAFSGAMKTLRLHSDQSSAAVRLIVLYQRCLAAAPTLRNEWCEGDEKVPRGPWRSWVLALQQAKALTSLLTLDEFEADIQQLRSPTNTEHDREAWRTAVNSITIRLRTHLRVLLTIETALVDGDSGRDPLRECILSLLAHHTVEDFDSGRLDILGADVELSAERYSGGRLLHVIANFLLRLNPDLRCDALNSLVGSTTDVRRLLALDVALQTDATTIIINRRLEELNLEETLSETFWLSDLQAVLDHAVVAQRDDEIETILKFGDTLMAGHPLRADWDVVAFNARIVQAYRAEDEVALQSMALPKGGRRGLQASDSRTVQEVRRQMFLYLLKLPEDPVRYVALLDRLLQRSKYPPSLTVNRFAAQVFAAEAETDDIQREVLATDALTKWELHKTTLTPQIQTTFSDTSTINTVRAFAILKRADDIELKWANLTSGLKSSSVVSEAVAHALLRVGRIHAARQVIELTRDRLVPSNQTLPQPLEELLDELNRYPISTPVFVEDPNPQLDPEIVRQALDQLRRGSAQQIAKIFGYSSLSDFLLNEMKSVVSHALERANHFNANLNEDGLTDWICSLLRSRLHILGWQFTDQSRGGTSTSGRSPGERDMVVRTLDSVSLAVIEFLKTESLNRSVIGTHIEKLLMRYDPSHSSTAMIVIYYTGDNFSKFWSRYVNYIENEHNFGNKRRLRSFRRDNSGFSAIRMGMTLHENGNPSQPLRLGHILVNLS